MDKQQLLNLINSKKVKRDAMFTRSQESTDVVEVRSLATEIADADTELVQLRSLYDSMPNETEEDWQQGQRSTNPVEGSGFNPLGSYAVGGQGEQRNEEEDIYSTMEYRQAFKNYVVNGTPIPEKFKREQRANAMSVVSDVSAVIPTHLLNKVIEDITVEGKILARVTQAALTGGIDIPLSDINPTATWLASETVTSDEQKAKMDAKISFGYHVLEAKVSMGLLTATVTLGVFEATIVKQLKKAMVKAIETAIVKGTGSGQPLGFTKVELPTQNVIKFKDNEIGTVTKWAEVEGAIDEDVEENVITLMAKATWEKYLNGMVDSTGQKIGLGRINEKGQKILNGREVLTLKNFPSYDACGNGEVFGAIIDLNQYILNSNLGMTYKKYFDEDANKWVHKALTIVDGKMAIGKTTGGTIVGAQSLILLKKDAAASLPGEEQ